MKVVLFLRRPNLNSFSIECIFNEMPRYLPPDIKWKICTSRFYSRGFFKRFLNILDAAFHQGDINHITGDVHFLDLFMFQKRTLLTIHDCVGLNRIKGLIGWIFRIFWYWLPVRRAAVISVVSEFTKNELLTWIKCDPDKIKIIPAIVSEMFQPHSKAFNENKPVLLQVGTGKNKNLLRIAQALRGINAHLRIIGYLSGEQLAFLKENDIDYSNVIGISEKNMLREYENCDVVIFASTYEGFGMPIAEGNAVGRPVITSNFGSMRVVAGGAAMFVNPFIVRDIRAGILCVISDPNIREEIVKKGFQNINRFRHAVVAGQ